MTDWFTPRTVAELGRTHSEEIPCAFCNHGPSVAEANCWCPLCLEEYRGDLYTVAEYGVYTRDCVSHGMAPPHGDGRSRATCELCRDADGSPDKGV